MKKITMFLFVNVIVSMCVAQTPPFTAAQKMLKNAKELSAALKVPLVSSSQIWTESFFPVGDIVSTNNLKFVKEDSPLVQSVRFAVSSNGNVIAYGVLYERTSYEAAHDALMLELVNNNMMLEILVMTYRLHVNVVGDFGIVATKEDNVTGAIVDDNSWIYFVRGAKAVSLRSKDGTDVRPIAKTLDGLLKR